MRAPTASTAYGTIAGSPGPLDRNTPSGSRARTSAAGVPAGTTSTVPEPGELAQDGPLDAEVVGHDPERPAADDGVRPVRRHLVHEVDPARARLAAGHGPQHGFGSVAEGTGHRAAVTEQAGEPPGVDAGDAGDAVAPEQAVEITVGPPVGPAPGQLPDHHAAAERAAGLEVGPVHAVVADVGVREGDDLARVARVGEDLLVARQDRVEDHLARGDTAGRFGSDQLALEDRSVGQDERALPRCTRAAHRAPPGFSRRSVSPSGTGRRENRRSLHGHASYRLIMQQRRRRVIAGPRRPARSARRRAGCGGPCPAGAGRRRACCGPGWPAGRVDHPLVGRVDDAQVGRPARARSGRRGRPGRRWPPAARTSGPAPARWAARARSGPAPGPSRGPSIPGGAWSKGSSFRWGAWGA